MKKIGIIGGGNMGTAIARGFVHSKKYQANEITISTLEERQCSLLSKEGFSTTKDNVALIKKSEVVIIVVKPYHILDILTELAHNFTQKQDIISVVAGVTLEVMGEALQKAKKPLNIYRMMPNIAAEIGQSFTALSTHVEGERRDNIFKTLELLGVVLNLEEAHLEAVTIMSGSGIAYAFRFLRAGMLGGTAIGLPPQVSSKIFTQVVKGAASLLLEKNEHPEMAIDKVTTPKGTTITGLNAMESKGFSDALITGIKESYQIVEK